MPENDALFWPALAIIVGFIVLTISIFTWVFWPEQRNTLDGWSFLVGFLAAYLTMAIAAICMLGILTGAKHNDHA
jgi:hypothetical protein